MRELNPQQARFVELYLVDLSAKNAAEAAGYKGDPSKAGHRLMKKPWIQAAIQAGMDERSKRTHIDQDYVLRQLHEVYQRAIQEVKPVTNARTGAPVFDDNGNRVFRYDSGAALTALKLIGQHVSISAFNPDASVKHTVELTLADRLLEGRKRAAIQNREARSLAGPVEDVEDESDNVTKFPTEDDQFYITGKRS